MKIENGHVLEMTDNMPIRTDGRTLIAIIGFFIGASAAGAMVYASVRADLADHSKQLSGVASDHNMIVTHTVQLDEVARRLDKMDRKLDYLTGASSERPSAGPPK